jgi:hypothetical protein
MRDFLILFVHMIVTVARLARPGGLRSVIAQSVLVRHQLLVLNRGRKRVPNLRAADRTQTLFEILVAGPSKGECIRPARRYRSMMRGVWCRVTVVSTTRQATPAGDSV